MANMPESRPNADSILMFMAQLDVVNTCRKGRGVTSRIYTGLKSNKEFSAVVDTFISASPGIAALVWGSVKVALQV
ncbi:hypothetical protein F5Y16DRAFT_374931 [Xylariaceae sp. FL0255]|nr:hypothetical protein F5Y16DRAFT_374931 [Xylariaceae sp. FL0255]